MGVKPDGIELTAKATKCPGPLRITWATWKKAASILEENRIGTKTEKPWRLTVYKNVRRGIRHHAPDGEAFSHRW